MQRWILLTIVTVRGQVGRIRSSKIDVLVHNDPAKEPTTGFDLGRSAQGDRSNRGIGVPVTSPKCQVRASCP